MLDEAGLRRLLAACSGRDFYDRRDAALIRFLLDTGARRSEVAAMTLKDLDLDNQIVRLAGKGSKERIAAFGAKTTRDLDRYLHSGRRDRARSVAGEAADH